jgi:hypothetical protein
MAYGRAPHRVVAATVLWVLGAVAVTLVVGADLAPRASEQLMMRDPAPPARATPPAPKTRGVTFEPWEKIPS